MSESDAKNSKKAGGEVIPQRSMLPCPECGKLSARENYPFCSARCRAVDLNRWLSGSYVLPGRQLDEDDAE